MSYRRFFFSPTETQAELLDRHVIRNGICVTGDSQPVEDNVRVLKTPAFRKPTNS